MYCPNDLIVVLVAPENPLNIGFVARAMRCNGVEELRICGSIWESLPDLAHRTGSSAPEILNSARFFPTLAEAVGDCNRAVAFSRRHYDLPLAMFTPRTLVDHASTSHRTALVFGRESAGLTRDEISLCSMLCAIPVVDGVSYNLGMAVAIALYELVEKENRASQMLSKTPLDPPLLSQQEALFSWVEQRSESLRNRGEQREIIRRLVQRMEPDRDELRALFGLLKAIARQSEE